jgi:hypothetical protein
MIRSRKPITIAAAVLLVAGAALAAGGGYAEPVHAPALAPAGTAFTYQGFLRDTGTAADGSYDFEFSLYDAWSGGAQVGSTLTVQDVVVAKGVFTVTLDFGSAFGGAERWLEIAIRPGASVGVYTTLSPRQPITAVPYAVTALNVPSHDHFGESWSGTGTGLSLTSTDTTGMVDGFWVETESDNGNGVVGTASSTTGPAWGVVGASNSNDGIGVFGSADAPTGNTVGVWGQTSSNSSDASGVYGYASGTSGSTLGITGVAESTNGTGVFGYALSATGDTTGVVGQTNSPDGIGVWGIATAPSGNSTAVWASNYSSNGNSVMGYSTAPIGSAIGVVGRTEADDGIGVIGYASSTASSGYPVGVYGSTDSPTGWAIYADGDLFAAGDMYISGTKSAVVETQDYGWRELYAVESPEVWFEDFGTATLTNGEATISIESVFAQTVNLAAGYHVFLTPLGDCPLYVSEKTETGFSVRALGGLVCEIEFDYRLAAKRIGYERLRLDPAKAPDVLERTADSKLDLTQTGWDAAPGPHLLK